MTMSGIRCPNIEHLESHGLCSESWRKMAGCQSQEGRAGHGLVRELAIGGCAAISISKGALGSALRAVQFFQRLLKVKNANSDGCRFDEVAEKKKFWLQGQICPGGV
jgi:hypothetical protein